MEKMDEYTFQFGFKEPLNELTKMFEQEFFQVECRSNIKKWQGLVNAGHLERFSLDIFGSRLSSTHSTVTPELKVVSSIFYKIADFF